MKHSILVCPSPQFTDAMMVNGANTAVLPANAPLSESEILCIQALARGRPNYPFVLKQLYGIYWGCIKAPRRFGLRFRSAVRAGMVPGIVCDDFVEGNTKLYRLTFPRP
jgi:hypothetical protein